MRRGDEYVDLALLTDGLRAEREQGITIDVAYRYFQTPRRKFIIADTPGPRAVHAQHGHRHIDGRPVARPDRRAQGRRRAVQAPHVHRVAARRPARRRRASTRWTSSTTTRACSTRSATSSREFAAQARDPRRRRSSRCSALHGDNVVDRSTTMPWYDGPAAALSPRARAHRLRSQPRSMRASRCSGSIRPIPTSTTTTAATPARWPAACCAGRRGDRAAVRAREHDRARSTPTTGRSRRRARRCP